MPMITLVNDFHNTKCVLRVAVRYDDGVAIIKPSARQLTRAKRVLCPSSSQHCTCSGVAGTRSQQTYDDMPLVVDDGNGDY